MNPAIARFLDEGRKFRQQVNHGKFAVVCNDNIYADLMQLAVEHTLKQEFHRLSSLCEAKQCIETNSCGALACLVVDADLEDERCDSETLIGWVDRFRPEVVIVAVTKEKKELDELRARYPRISVVGHSGRMCELIDNLFSNGVGT
uniref:Response regulatory domain-containing protein n=1 Tax=viral metagenome TaxID=1070528 RepID=A0A6M3IWS4_9ZZZZ